MGLTRRQGEALEHDVSLSMTAGAGTGKTRVLVEKYLDILEKVPDAKVSNILALTYTEKAAAEMKERIVREVRKRPMGRIREELIYSNISTIHSFCSRVIRAFPIELGMDPGFRVIDEMDDKMLRDEVISEILYTELHPDIRENVKRLLGNSSEYYLKASIRELYGKRPLIDDVKDDFLSRSKEEVVEKWEMMASSYLEELVVDTLKRKDITDAACELSRIASEYPGSGNAWLEFLREFEMINE
ncbi:MAG: UvrD-helicase domain-containing protein, partial [Candidatus Thermoplasmatota archaeon]|nr:UvrD-helicase domain-containing protein [Candidatus Thermoplasmatota archaeon]